MKDFKDFNIYDIRHKAFIFKKTISRAYNYNCHITDTSHNKLFTSEDGFIDKTSNVFNKLFAYLKRNGLKDWSFISCQELESHFLLLGIDVSVTSSKEGRQMFYYILIHDLKELLDK